MKIASNAVMSVASTLRSGLLAGILVVFAFASCEMMEPPPATDPPPPTAKASVDTSNIIELGSATLSASESTAASDDIPIKSYLWEQIDNGPRAAVDDATADMTSFKAPFVHEMLDLEFRLTVTGSNDATATSTVTVTVSPSPNVDADGDGLIEIDSLAMLHNMRYDTTGASYKTSDSATGLTSGCPAAPAGCIGYELTRSLDFDTDGNGTWSGDNASGFMLDPNDSRSPYFVVEADGTGGWHPIGTSGVGKQFLTTFEGNGYTISNLAIRRDVDGVGFFAIIGNDDEGTTAVIRNIGLINNLADYTGDRSGSTINVGGLVANQQQGGSVIASYATGIASASASAAGSVTVGGLIGTLGGTVIGSYTTGNAYGSNGLLGDTVGGLVGSHRGAIIIASYARGSVDGGGGATDHVGGLVGSQTGGNIVASYATGNVSGGADNNDRGGKLVGRKSDNATITDSYAFGNLSEAETPNTEGDPGSLTAATLSATATSAGTKWDDSESDTAGAWDFGTASQAPVLRYADYDGPSGDVYSCDGATPTFPAGFCGTIIPGQGR